MHEAVDEWESEHFLLDDILLQKANNIIDNTCGLVKQTLPNNYLR